MYSLNLLGGAALEGPDGPVAGRAAHRRRLAVLAVLALARGRAVARERLTGLLWPDHPTDAARHLLSESLYVLRKELGESTIATHGDEVGLNADVVRCDAAEMERAAEAGEMERAAELYRGPLLDGFYVSDAPEFERWVEGERERIARLHVRAVEVLAETAEAAGRPQEAAGWWRRLAVQDPYNTRVAVRLMLALDASGERASALWFAQTHTALLREEMGVEPGDELAALVERLRSEPLRVPAEPPAAALHAPESSQAPDLPPEPEPAAEPAPLAAPDPAAESAPGATPAPPEPVPPARRWPVHTHRYAAAALVLAVALALAATLLRGGGGAGPESEGHGFDPRRIAVLYFDDHSPGGELEYLASGLTESLIHALAGVDALDVVSRHGVKPYRDRAVRFDSMVADLRVGSVVEGSVQRSGDSVRVTVQLIDGRTGSHLESRTVVHPLADPFALEDALAGEVSASLRRRLGRHVAARRTLAETRSARAWDRVLRAEQLRNDAARLATTRDPLDASSADRLLLRADSLLADAERADPAWTRPVVLRGWIASRRSGFAGAGGGDARVAEALAHAERALRRAPGDARALELRGTVRFRRAAASRDAEGEGAGLDAAESDLRAAVAADPALASAWNTLSMLLGYRGRFAEADLAARRALAEDAYLEGVDDIHHRLHLSALLLADHAAARAWCERGGERFPADWRFVECRLTLLREETSRQPDPAAARALLGELEEVDPPARARAEGRAYTPAYRLALAAAVLARAGEADSARALLARAHAAVGGDPVVGVSLAYDEAYVRLLLGEREAARRLLARVLEQRPAMEAFAARDPLFREILTPPSGTPRRNGGSPSPPDP